MAALDNENAAHIRQAMERTLQGFLMSYVDASQHNDAIFISAHLSADCARQFGPSSFLKTLGAPIDLAMANEPYQAHVAKQMAVWLVKRVEIANVCIDTAARKAAATTIYYGELSDGEQNDMELAWFLTFSEDGTKVAKILEYVDAAENIKFEAKANALLAKLGTGGV